MIAYENKLKTGVSWCRTRVGVLTHMNTLNYVIFSNYYRCQRVCAVFSVHVLKLVDKLK
jgi:hypothetical protein